MGVGDVKPKSSIAFWTDLGRFNCSKVVIKRIFCAKIRFLNVMKLLGSKMRYYLNLKSQITAKL